MNRQATNHELRRRDDDARYPETPHICSATGPGRDAGRLRRARDGSGNLYVAGAFQQSIVLGGTMLTSKGDWDIFVWKRPP